MAPRKPSKSKILAKLAVGKKGPCAFCHSVVDDEINYGKIYIIGDLYCHYFCVLLSSCLIQKGKDEEGLFGFLYEDIVTEVERCKKHKCSFCYRPGANLGCSISQCKKQFHLPCGKVRNAVSLFYGNYKSFCQSHAPKQIIPESIMSKARIRMRANKTKTKHQNFKDLKELSDNTDENAGNQSVCVICYEAVDGFPTVNTFWPPCCARDAWFHRSCLLRMALSAGMHYLKCPLCNDKDSFYRAVLDQGYYIPDRDAAWELEQNAFSEIYDREVSCSEEVCQCPMGRSHDDDNGSWSMKLCVLCGSAGAHGQCTRRACAYICVTCAPAAPTDVTHLLHTIQAVISQEQTSSQNNVMRGPIMPVRMSLRRTKPKPIILPSSSSQVMTKIQSALTPESSSRQDLNLRTPKKPESKPIQILNSSSFYECSPTKLLQEYNSPTKLFEEGLKIKLNDDLLQSLRIQFKKPKPLCEKKKIVTDVLSGMFDKLLLENKKDDEMKQISTPNKCIENDAQIMQHKPDITHTPRKDTTSEDKISPIIIDLTSMDEVKSPKKRTVDFEQDSSLEISENNDIVSVDLVKLENDENCDVFNEYKPLCSVNKNIDKMSLKFSPNREILKENQVDFDIESFKNEYLSEVVRQSSMSMLKKRQKIKNKRKQSKKRKDDFVLRINAKERKMERKNNISIKNKNLKLKIQWKKQQLQLRISDSKKNKIKNGGKLKQYVLECNDDCTKFINKPEVDVTPIKRKYVKIEKSPDNLVQTSIQKFFKITAPNKE